MVCGPLNWPKKVFYDTSENCIYCGSSNVVGEEHIIPLALYGDLVIPNGSCLYCAHITGQLEQLALHGVYKYLRERLGYPHRHKKVKRDAFPIFVPDGSGHERRVEIPLEEYPHTSLFFNPPSPQVRIWNSLVVPPYDVAPGLYFRSCVTNHQIPYLQKMGIKEFSHPSLNIFCLYRMLAKIGHSYVVAELGAAGFRPLLSDIILGKSRNYLDFIGGTSDKSDTLRYAYSIQLARFDIGGVACIGVLLRIFANEPHSPTYEVIVGTLYS